MFVEVVVAVMAFPYSVFLLPGGLILYYLICWAFVGRKMHQSVIVTCYEAPDGLSPAGVRFLRAGGTDGRSVASAIAHMAALGRVEITAAPSGAYSVARREAGRAGRALPPEENDILSVMFYSGDSIILEPRSTGHSTLAEHLDRALRKHLGEKYVSGHFGLVFIGGMFSFIGALVLLAASAKNVLETVFLSLWIMLVGTLLGVVFWATFSSVRRSATHSTGGLRKAIQSGVIFAIFAGGLVFAAWGLGKISSPPFADMLAGIVFINVMCAPLLKSFTKLGRETLCKIEGFREFLAKVEQDQLSRLNTAGASPTTLNENLSYAIALDLRDAWGDRFCEEFAATEILR